MRTMPQPSNATIASAYLPSRFSLQRWHYHYARSKLRTDPLYAGVADALRGADAPLLDLGCGIGLLAHWLRAVGIAVAYRGVDHDIGKIDIARQSARRARLQDVAFDTRDLAAALPRHHGSVAILDVLQYLDDDAQRRVLDDAIAMLVPGARLVIRTGIDDGDGRIRGTRAIDRFATAIGWMQGAPHRYPRAQALLERLQQAGLEAAFTPLRGNALFNNWLVVARRD